METYIVVTSDDLSELIEAVNNRLGKGYSLLGGIATNMSYDTEADIHLVNFYQAMVKQ